MGSSMAGKERLSPADAVALSMQGHKGIGGSYFHEGGGGALVVVASFVVVTALMAAILHMIESGSPAWLLLSVFVLFMILLGFLVSGPELRSGT